MATLETRRSSLEAVHGRMAAAIYLDSSDRAFGLGLGLVLAAARSALAPIQAFPGSSPAAPYKNLGQLD